MKLVSNVSQAWRMLSIRIPALSVTLATAWLSVPEDIRAAVPPQWVAIIAGALSALSIVGRLIDQGLDK